MTDPDSTYRGDPCRCGACAWIDERCRACGTGAWQPGRILRRQHVARRAHHGIAVGERYEVVVYRGHYPGGPFTQRVTHRRVGAGLDTPGKAR